MNQKAIVTIALLCAVGNLCFFLWRPVMTRAALGPGYEQAVIRAQSMLSEAKGTPRLDELLVDKYGGVDQIAQLLVHDDSGRTAGDLLSEGKDELRIYQNYKTGSYQYNAKVRAGCLGIYKGDACVANIPLEFDNGH